VAGWGQHGDITRQLLTLVNLRYRDEHPRIAARFGLVDDIVREVRGGDRGGGGRGGGAPGPGFWDLVIFGDFVSLHLAAQEGRDPGPVPVLTEIKSRLESGRGGRGRE